MNLKEIGRRIAHSRKAAGMKTPAELAVRIFKKPGGGSGHVTAENVRQWESGSHCPPLEKLTQIAAAVNQSEEYLLFGRLRGEQLRAEARHLQYINDLESELLTVLRQADPKVHVDILSMVRTMAKTNPSDSADVLKLRRKKN